MYCSGESKSWENLLLQRNRSKKNTSYLKTFPLSMRKYVPTPCKLRGIIQSDGILQRNLLLQTLQWKQVSTQQPPLSLLQLSSESTASNWIKQRSPGLYSMQGVRSDSILYHQYSQLFGENMVSAQQPLGYNEAHLLQAISQVRITSLLLLLLASSERLSKQSDGILH